MVLKGTLGAGGMTISVDAVDHPRLLDLYKDEFLVALGFEESKWLHADGPLLWTKDPAKKEAAKRTLEELKALGVMDALKAALLEHAKDD